VKCRQRYRHFTSVRQTVTVHPKRRNNLAAAFGCYGLAYNIHRRSLKVGDVRI
jgi:hypothetical protein